MKTTKLLSVLLCAGLALVACVDDERKDSAEARPVEQESPFELRAPQANWPLTSDQKDLQSRLDDFGFRLFRLAAARQDEGKSLMLSPLSVDYAFGMVALACDGTPLREFNALMGLQPDDRAAVHDLLASLMTQLPALDAGVKMNLANAFYLNASRSDLRLNPDYQKLLQTAYAADCEALDFEQQKATADYINAWCNRQTNGFIPKLFDADDIDTKVVSYLLNALYFKACWTLPFDKELTHDRTFTREDGTTVQVPMMYQSGRFQRYADTDLCQVLQLPYSDFQSRNAGQGDFAMTILLPHEGKTVSDVLGVLSADYLRQLRQTFAGEKEVWPNIALGLPSFETQTTTQLTPLLPALGLSSWLEGPIRGMVQELDGTPHSLMVSKAFQAARIKVDEAGTEAAAVTAVSVTDGMLHENPTVFVADHPFVYLITEEKTGTLLFIGTYMGD